MASALDDFYAGIGPKKPPGVPAGRHRGVPVYDDNDRLKGISESVPARKPHNTRPKADDPKQK